MSAADQIIQKINDQLKKLDENQLTYVLTFLKKLFGSN